MPTFLHKVSLALEDAFTSMLATSVSGNKTAEVAQDSQNTDQQQPNAAPNSDPQVQALDKQYQKLKQDVEKAEREANGKSDIGLFRKSASMRKRMEDVQKQYQIALSKANGMQPNQKTVNGLPQDAVV
jgi:uncharacterized protein YlxW (UPF0749 family)